MCSGNIAATGDTGPKRKWGAGDIGLSRHGTQAMRCSGDSSVQETVTFQEKVMSGDCGTSLVSRRQWGSVCSGGQRSVVCGAAVLQAVAVSRRLWGCGDDGVQEIVILHAVVSRRRWCQRDGTQERLLLWLTVVLSRG